MNAFRRRYYSSPGEFWRDFRGLISNRAVIKEAMSGGGITAAFRERLMLVVTEVNGCRYCRSFHAPQAFKAGVSPEELQELLSGLVPSGTPEEQQLALVYARHWAENNANPDPVFRERIQDVYGAETARAIGIILRMIRMGNLLGNTWDYLLYRISFGRWGGVSGSSRTDQVEKLSGEKSGE